MIQLPKPQITGKTTSEQIEQFRGYLYNLVEQLNWALASIDDSIKMLTGSDDTSNKTTYMKPSNNQFIKQRGQAENWLYVLYNDGTCSLFRYFNVKPESNGFNMIGDTKIYVSKDIQIKLPFHVFNCVVSGDDITTKSPIVGVGTSTATDNTPYAIFKIKSHTMFSGTDEHLVELKVVGKLNE